VQCVHNVSTLVHDVAVKDYYLPFHFELVKILGFDESKSHESRIKTPNLPTTPSKP
jgi:hypothetical protein